MSLRKFRVLVADDEPGMRELFQYVLEPFGFEIVAAHDGVAALEAVEARSFDLVYLDVHMPRLLGTDAFELIRQRRPEAAVWMMTSQSSPLVAKAGALREQGAAGLLLKPFTLDELLASTSKLVMGDARGHA